MSNGTGNVIVDTTAIANVVSRLSGHIDSVGNEIGNLRNETQHNLQQLQAEVTGGLALTAERVNAVRNEIARGIEAEAQSRILEEFSEIAGQMVMIQSAADRLKEEFNNAILRNDDLAGKFDKLNNLVIEGYQTDIRRLGKFIFEIWENNFSKTVETRISKQHLDLLSTVSSSIEKIRQMRENRLAVLFQEVSSKLSAFIDRRRKFENSVQAIKIKELQMPDDTVNIPLLYLKSEDRKFSAMQGYEVKPSNDPNVQFKFEKTDYFNEIDKKIGDINKRVTWQKISDDNLEKLIKDINLIIERGYISKEYGDYLIKALKLSPPEIPVNKTGYRNNE